MFTKLMNDRVTVKTSDGSTYTDVAASVQRDRIYTLRTDVPIRPGDLISRRLPAGVEEVFIVEDPGFHSGIEGIPDSYQMRVRREHASRGAASEAIDGMTDQLSATFVSYACDILADTSRGLSGPQIVKVTAAYSVARGVTIPHPTYPFSAAVPNKRTALYENLMAFTAPQRYRIIRELCDHPALQERNREAAAKLKLTLIARYGRLADEALGSEVDSALVERTQHWLGPFPDALALYDQAVKKHANAVFLRNVLDDLRLSLELLLKPLLGNDKSLENQISYLGVFIKQRGGSPELANMFVKLVDYYSKYQNSYVKHDDAVIEEEVEFIFELTSSFMKHLVRLSYKEAV